jgi:paraquat-inducible protein A
MTSFTAPVASNSLRACPQCDLLQNVPALEPGQSARCPRCNVEMRRRRRDSLERTRALAVAATFLYVIANSVPMLGLTVMGHEASTTVFGGAVQLWKDNEKIVAVVVLFAAVVAPALQILTVLGITFAALQPRVPRWVGALMRYHPVTRTWSMVEVMLLGVLVALIKIAELATVIPGVALFALGALVVVLAAIQSMFDPEEIWERVEWACDSESAGDLPGAASESAT